MSDNEAAAGAGNNTDFKNHFQELQHQWKIALKRNKKCLLKCPNYNQCQFKCGSIGGMTYHYTRCSGTRPQFQCEVCGKEYESRTGLNYHNAATHHDRIAQQAKTGAAQQEPVTDSNPSRPPVKSLQPSSPLSPTVKKRGRRGRPRKNKMTFGAGHGSDHTSSPPPSSEGSPPPEHSNLPLKKVTITIPSIEYPEKYRSYLPVWRDELKVNEFVICPNYSQCQFKCTTVNGMKYHFTRCQKDQLPVFQCQLCTRMFHCRSGLVWHLKNTHRLSDLPPNQKTIQVVVSKGATPTNECEPTVEGKVKRRRGRPPRVPIAERGRSVRKSLYPRRTAADILHQLLQAERIEAWRDDHISMVPVSPPPIPRLHPCSTPSPVPPTEFIITDDIPTDVTEHSSFIVDYPEELLTTWHRWYSSDESDGEEDWREQMPWSTHSPVHSAPLASLSDRSSSSASDDSSDEDYSFSKVARKGVGRGRGRGKKIDKEAKRIPGIQPMKLATPPQPPPLKPVTDSIVTVPKIPPLVSSLPLKTKSDLSPVKKVQEPRPPPTTTVKKQVKVAPRPVSHTPVTTPTGVVQYYPIQVHQNVPNLVPMQLVGSGAQAVQSSSVSYQMAQTQTGKLVLLSQSGTQSPQYAIQTSSSGTPQRVSVIMNPGTVVYTTQGHSASTSRGYITQLDGPPGGTRKRKGTAKQSKEELRKTFEAARSAERQRKAPSPGTSAQSHDISDPSAKLPENLMSTQLQNYLSRSQEQQIRSRSSTSPSPILTSPTMKQKQQSNPQQSRLAISPTMFDHSESATTTSQTTTTISDKERPVTASSTVSQSVSSSTTQSTDPLAATSGSGKGKKSSSTGKGRKTAASKRTTKEPVGRKGKRPRTEISTDQQDETVNDQQLPRPDAEAAAAAASTSVVSVTSSGVKKSTAAEKGRKTSASSQRARKKTNSREGGQTGAKESVDKRQKEDEEHEAVSCIESQQGGEGASTITASPGAADTSVKRRRGRPGRPPAMVQTTGKYKCNSCNAGLNTKALLRKHKDTTHFPLPVDAPISDLKPLWRKAIKYHKLVACDRCLAYQAVSVISMVYHYERCGREVEQEVCQHCSKKYTTRQGLQYHIKVAHSTPSKEDAAPPSVEHVVSSTDVPGVRKAAASATAKMKEELEKGKEGGSRTKVKLVLEDVDQVVSNEELLRLKEHFLQHGSVQCPQQGCSQEFKSYHGLVYHLKNKQQYACPHCCRLFSKRKLLNHIRNRHPELEIDTLDDDTEFTPVSVPAAEMEQDEGGGEEEGAELMAEVEELTSAAVEETPPPPPVVAEQPRLNIPTRSVFGTEGTEQAVLKLLSVLNYNNGDTLFPKWIPKISHFKQVPVSEQREYLALSHDSIAVSAGDQRASITLPLYSASSLSDRDGSKDVLMNAGGSVWSMDWAPIPDPSSDQYLALAAYRQPHETHRIDLPLAHKGLIQLWNVGKLTNDQKVCPAAFLSLGFAHDYGVIRDMQWCPSGCWEKEMTTPIASSSCWTGKETTSDGELRRLGLLAVACSDGKLRILSIPHPQCCTSDDDDYDIVAPVHVPATLIPGGCGDNTHYGQCLCVTWLPGNGHRKIAAGFSNGSVVVWDLLSSLSFQFDHSRGVVFSQTVLMAHSGPCRCVVWCPTDHFFLFTGGHDKRGCLWDLRQPHTPVEQFEKNWLTEAHWPLLWSGVHVLEEIGLSKKYGPLYLCFNSQICSPGRIYTSSGPVMSCSYSNWSSQLATGSVLGELHVTDTKCSFYTTLRSKSACSKNKTVLWCSLESTSEENEDNDSIKLVFNKSQVPKTMQYSVDCSGLTSITKVLWHPSHHCHRWLVVALSCGLVRLVHTS